MPMTHSLASGIGGIRTAGDLVAWMQMIRKMRINDAKAYVADKLKVSPMDLSDPFVMRDIREELDIGIITAAPGYAKGAEARARIAELLEIEINSVNRLRDKLKGG
jgi:dimethylamine--corrinoid protein Co-methyltransferase